MSRLQRTQWRTVQGHQPPDLTANSTDSVINVGSGDFTRGDCIVSITEVFNGTGTAAIIIVGDGDDPNGLLEDTQCDEVTLGLYRGGGAYYSTRPKLYTATDTIDVGLTAATGNDGTTGRLDLAVDVQRVHPW